MYAPKTADGYPTEAPPMAYGPPQGMAYGPPQGMAPFQVQQREPQPWSTGLCDCTDDCGNCWLTWCCPCITFGRIAEIVDQGSTSCGTSGALYTLLALVTGCQWIYSCTYRSKYRHQYSLEEAPCNDCLVHCCCEPCALCQEYRQLKSQGYDMKIGWHANMERRAQGTQTFPPQKPGDMIR